jgi:hypothetical protein
MGLSWRLPVDNDATKEARPPSIFPLWRRDIDRDISRSESKKRADEGLPLSLQPGLQPTSQTQNPQVHEPSHSKGQQHSHFHCDHAGRTPFAPPPAIMANAEPARAPYAVTKRTHGYNDGAIRRGRAAQECDPLVPSQVHRWKNTDVQFRSQYEQALAFRTDLQLGEIIESPIVAAPGWLGRRNYRSMPASGFCLG